MIKTLCCIFVGAGYLLVGTPAIAQGGCYDIGQGPIRVCYQGNRSVKVFESFIYSKNNSYYSYNSKVGTYCYKNEYGNERCMQMWKVKTLECSHSGGGPLKCG